MSRGTNCIESEKLLKSLGKQRRCPICNTAVLRRGCGRVSFRRNKGSFVKRRERHFREVDEPSDVATENAKSFFCLFDQSEMSRQTNKLSLSVFVLNDDIFPTIHLGQSIAGNNKQGGI